MALDAARTPRLSVVMPSLNQGRFLEEAVRSVLASPVPDIELVVSDGGSTDSTLSILAALGDEFAGRLRWYSQPDSGPAQAIDHAISLARAPLIGWVNSDDLYAAGAIESALAHFEASPDDVMAYGEGEHVDEHGAFLEPYPTLPPSTPIDAFLQGCFICQPTVFFRREAFDAVGGLDHSLRASFDFDLWLRFFKAFPGRIGFMPRVLAKSRLHEAGITLSQRARVAREGITVLGRHLGWAPPDWALTWVEEMCAKHPFQPQQFSMRDQLESLMADCAAALGEDGLEVLARRMEDDTRLRLSTSQVYVGAHADGWAGPLLEIRLLQSPTPLRGLRLLCRHHSPAGGPLHLELVSPDGAREPLYVAYPGLFSIDLDLSGLPAGARAIYRVHCAESFVPADHEPGSRDLRALAFRVEDCGTEPATAA